MYKQSTDNAFLSQKNEIQDAALLKLIYQNTAIQLLFHVDHVRLKYMKVATDLK